MKLHYTDLAFCWHWLLLPVLGLVHIEEQLEHVVVDEGDKARFVCKTDTHPLDGERLKLEWKHNGHYLNVSDSSKYRFKLDSDVHVLTIQDADLRDAGVYSCIASVGIDTDISSARLTVRGAPDPPVDVQVINCPGQSAEILWQPGPNNGAKISGYIVQFNTSQNPDAWFDYFDMFPGKITTGFVDLSPWGTYSFRVLAKNSVGLSKPSRPTKKTCTTPPDRPDANPKDVRSRTDKKNMLVIEWTPMHRLYHHGPGFRYRVYWRPKGSTFWHEDVVEDPDVGYYETEVGDVYGCYEIQVKAENNLGESYQRTYIFLGHSGEAEPLVSPKDFRIDPTHPVEPHTAHFIWEAVDSTEEKIRGKFRGYKLRYWKSSEGRRKKKEVDIIIESSKGHTSPDVRVALSDLPSYTALRAQVAVMNTHYTGPPSQIIDFFTPEGVPGPVRDLHTEAYGMSYVLLKWLPPVEPNGILIGYDIGYQPVLGQKVGQIKALRPQITNPSTLGARITGLEPNHEYRFYVWARTDSGRGNASFTDIKTADGTPPSAPEALISNIDEASVNLTWGTALRNGEHYLIEYRQMGDNHWRSADSDWDRPWKLLYNLAPDSKYEVRVVARNRLGDTATSNTLTVSTNLEGGKNYYNSELKNLHRSGAKQMQSSLCPSHLASVLVTLLHFLVFHR